MLSHSIGRAPILKHVAEMVCGGPEFALRGLNSDTQTTNDHNFAPLILWYCIGPASALSLPPYL